MRVPNFDSREAAIPEIKLHTVMSEDVCSSVFIKRGELPLLAPSEYSKAEVEKILFALDLGADEVALRLPPAACGKDIEVIDKLLREVPIKTLVAESLYGLSYAKKGFAVIAGEGLNIANNFAAAEATKLGACAIVPSLEFANGIAEGFQSGAEKDETAKAKSGLKSSDDETRSRIYDDFCAPVRVFASDRRYPLMTLSHCPYKTLFAGDCAHCCYAAGLTLSREKRVYNVRRVRMSRCVFELYGAF